MVIGLRPEYPPHRSNEAVEQDCALRISGLLDKCVVVQREDIDPLEREGTCQQPLEQVTMVNKWIPRGRGTRKSAPTSASVSRRIQSSTSDCCSPGLPEPAGVSGVVA